MKSIINTLRGTPMDAFIKGKDTGIISDSVIRFLSKKIPKIPQDIEIQSDMVLDLSMLCVTFTAELYHQGSTYAMRSEIIGATDSDYMVRVPRVDGYVLDGYSDARYYYQSVSIDTFSDRDDGVMLLDLIRFLFMVFDDPSGLGFDEDRTSRSSYTNRIISYRGSKNYKVDEWLVSAHFRLQPYGTGREKYKLILIKPMKRKRHKKEA